MKSTALPSDNPLTFRRGFAYSAHPAASLLAADLISSLRPPVLEGTSGRIAHRRFAMANTSSAKKAARQALRRTAVNKMRRTRVRGQVRKAEEALAAKTEDAAAAFVAAQSALMKAVKTGTVHKNTASRKISRLAARLKAAQA
jgi:small subunit ribosomal protein S20